MQIPQFGLTVTIDKLSRNRLVEKNGVNANVWLNKFERELTDEFGQKQDLKIEMTPTRDPDGTVYHHINAYGTPTDPETSQKLRQQKSTLWDAEDDENFEDVADIVFDELRKFIAKFNIQ